MSLILVIGGTRSGKSLFAENLASGLAKNVAYLATAQSLDEEMETRITQHQLRRPEYWTTYEEPYNVPEIIAKIKKQYQVILLDCLTLLVSNLLLQNLSVEDNNSDTLKDKENLILKTVNEIIENMMNTDCQLIIVSSEVGQGLVPSDALSRAYRDIVGRCNQLLAQKATKVFLVYAGLPVQLKPNLEVIHSEN